MTRTRQRLVLGSIVLVAATGAWIAMSYSSRLTAKAEMESRVRMWHASFTSEYSQVCYSSEPREVEFTVSGISYPLFTTSPEGFRRGRRDREAGIVGLREVFRGFISGELSPSIVYAVSLNAAIDLNAIELLPELLDLESRLFLEEGKGGVSHDGAEVLTAIATILRTSEYPPVMASELGKASNIPPAEFSHLRRDSWPVTDEWRSRIRKWAGDFTRQNPDFDGATKMLPETYRR